MLKQRKVKQLVVAAGGVGKRLDKDLNPLSSKVLIECNGKTLLWYLLNWAKQAGIKEFFISVNKKNKKKINNIAKSLGLKYYLKLTSPSFRGVPLLFEKKLDNRFMVICGHHPIPKQHLTKMLNSKKTIVFSAFSHPCKSQRQILVTSTNKLKPNSKYNPKSYYLDSPFIITKSLSKKMRSVNFQKTMHQLVYDYWLKKRSLGIIRTEIPAEFDDCNEFEEYLRFLKNKLKC